VSDVVRHVQGDVAVLAVTPEVDDPDYSQEQTEHGTDFLPADE
jgi:hypothetical protein